MSDSIFGDLDLEGASDDPFKVNGGTYTTVLEKISKTSKADKNGLFGLSVNFKIFDCEDDPAMNGRTISEYKAIPQPKDPRNPTDKEAQATAYLKQRLVSLGITKFSGSELAEELQRVTGEKYIVTVVENGDYTNVRSVKAMEDSAPTLAGNPFKAAGKK